MEETFCQQRKPFEKQDGKTESEINFLYLEPESLASEAENVLLPRDCRFCVKFGDGT